MKKALVGILAVAGLAAASNAALEVRLINAATNVVLGSEVELMDGESLRIRIQFSSDQPGGVVGWNAGSIVTTGANINTRTPGRLAPWNFAPDPPANGVPSADPFVAITGIDNTLGFQTRVWPAGQPERTPPIIRGFNTFVSTYEITTVASGGEFYITFAGNAVDASGWGIISETPPMDGEDGETVYAPMTNPPLPFSITIGIPAPGAAALFPLAALHSRRRR